MFIVLRDPVKIRTCGDSPLIDGLDEARYLQGEIPWQTVTVWMEGSTNICRTRVGTHVFIPEPPRKGNIMEFLRWLFDAQWHIGGSSVLVREVLGNLFGLASALGGMRRKVWAWPVGICGNLLLFTVFMGTLFGGQAHAANMLGQAGRQVMFIAVSAWGWYRWKTSRDEVGAAVVPEWASWRQRALMVAFMLVGTGVLTPLFRALGSYEPVWSDAWIFTGSLLATYGMARGWVEFWLVWVAVDVVGTPLLWSAGYYATALMYVFYGAFTLTGFFVWWATRNREMGRVQVQTRHLDPSIDVVRDDPR